MCYSKLIGKVDPDIDKDKRILELEDENRQFKLQISALKKELDRINRSKYDSSRREDYI